MKKAAKILLNALPMFVMVWLITLVSNDYILTALYIFIIIFSLLVKREKGDVIVLLFGLCIMAVCEYIFISTRVEIFVRNSLFGLMPLWLPFLWGYAFVAIKRSVLALLEE